jgi:hypothetical protein
MAAQIMSVSTCTVMSIAKSTRGSHLRFDSVELRNGADDDILDLVCCCAVLIVVCSVRERGSVWMGCVAACVTASQGTLTSWRYAGTCMRGVGGGQRKRQARGVKVIGHAVHVDKGASVCWVPFPVVIRHCFDKHKSRRPIAQHVKGKQGGNGTVFLYVSGNAGPVTRYPYFWRSWHFSWLLSSCRSRQRGGTDE